MNKRTVIISYLLLAVLTAPEALLAQAGSGSKRDWEAVMTVQSGKRLAIKLKNGQTVEGKLSGVSETGLALTSGGRSVEIKREEARQIYRITEASAKKPALVGAAIGAAGGAGLGAAAVRCKYADGPCYRPLTVPAGAAVGAGVGALVGLAIGKARHKRTLIYEVK